MGGVQFHSSSWTDTPDVGLDFIAIRFMIVSAFIHVDERIGGSR